jgi:hypothetical protein
MSATKKIEYMFKGYLEEVIKETNKTDSLVALQMLEKGFREDENIETLYYLLELLQEVEFNIQSKRIGLLEEKDLAK